MKRQKQVRFSFVFLHATVVYGLRLEILDDSIKIVLSDFKASYVMLLSYCHYFTFV